jgi:hypothetical protein
MGRGKIMHTSYFTAVFSLFLLFIFTGCCQECSVQQYRPMDAGTAISPAGELPIGAPYANFKFCDPQGRSKSLSSFKGDFTVLAFTACDDNYSSELSQISDLVGEKSNWMMRVAGMDIFWTPTGCAPPEQCSALPQFAGENFMAVCDGEGQIRRLYNVNQSGRYFIIGPDGKIMNKGDLCDFSCLQASLCESVDAYQKERDDEMKENGI